MTVAEPLLRIRDIRKTFGGLRPLRMKLLDVHPGERVALSGLDATAAELFVNLVTGASLPDEGTIETFGRPTSDVTEGDEWLASLDRFGIVSPRGVLLEGATLRQNLTLPYTLDMENAPVEIAEKVSSLARECGIAEEDLARPAGEFPAHVRMRAHLARAVALGPQLLLVEHPTAGVAEHERARLGLDVAAVADRHGAAVLAMTLDLEFAEGAAHRLLALQPATGALEPWKRKRGWFR
jgi:ABC-type branched-subunit amino acid transport system ATPase component